MPVECTCGVCGAAFSVNPSKVATGRGRYCSVICKGLAQRERTGAASTNWRGGQPWVGADGYVHLSVARRKQRLHRLVWEAAHGPIPPGHHVHHVNGVKTDNRLENLELLRHADHIRGHAPKKLSDADVRAIRARYAAGGTSHARLGREYGVNASTITRILHRRKWRHLD